MDSPLLNTLAAQGCQVADALDKTFMGREAFYEKMLRKLPQSECLVKLRTALEANDAKAAFEASHELKGVYATLGLTPLYEKCCEIVEITRAGSTEGTLQLLPNLEAQHASFIQIIAP